MLKTVLVSLALVLVIAVSGFAAFAFLARPSMRRAPTLTATATPERLARGEYLAQGCLDCHSRRDFKRYAGPAVPPFGVHGDCFDKGVGVPSQNTIMPWPVYNKFTDEDLGIIYDYLKAQKPVAHTVDKFPKTPRG